MTLPVHSFLEQELVQTDLAGTLSSGDHRCQLHSLRGKRPTGGVDMAKYSGVQAHNSENRLVILRQGAFLNKKHKQMYVSYMSGYTCVCVCYVYIHTYTHICTYIYMRI